MSRIPTDCILMILSFNYNFISEINLINKECYRIFNKNNFRDKIAQIFKWYKRNTYSFAINQVPKEKITKINLVQLLRKKYNRFELDLFIDFLIQKINRHDLRDYMITKMKPRHFRTKFEIIEFLKLPSLSRDEIIYVGLDLFNI